MVNQIIRDQKSQTIAHIEDVAKRSFSMVAAHYRGTSVKQMSELRDSSRKMGVYIKIVKNTLARRALEKTQYAGVTEQIKGPIVLMFSLEEPSASAKLVKEHIKQIKTLKVQVIGLETKVLAPEAIEQIAKLPNKQQAIAMLLAGLQGPITRLSCVLKETYSKLVRTVSEVSNVRQAKQ